MTLKAKNPENIVASKPKFLISGESGVGKTFFALDFPKPYLIDTEGGATRQQYQDKLKKSGGVYFGKEEGSQDFESIIEEIKALATTKHDYKTLIIDSFSYVYLLTAAEAELSGGSEFGRDKREANKPTRQLIRWLEKLDMNVILICHSKGKWTKKGKDLYQEGTTFDGYDKLEFILDLWVEILPSRKTMIIRKSRIESFQRDEIIPVSYEKFAELYGKDIVEKISKPTVMADLKDIAKAKELIETLNVPPEQVEKWFKKLDVESWEEMTVEQTKEIINLMTARIKKIKEESDGNKKS